MEPREAAREAPEEEEEDPAGADPARESGFGQFSSLTSTLPLRRPRRIAPATASAAPAEAAAARRRAFLAPCSGCESESGSESSGSECSGSSESASWEPVSGHESDEAAAACATAGATAGAGAKGEAARARDPEGPAETAARLEIRHVYVVSDEEEGSDAGSDVASDSDPEGAGGLHEDFGYLEAAPVATGARNKKRSGLFRVLSSTQNKANLDADLDDAQNPAHASLSKHKEAFAMPEHARARLERFTTVEAPQQQQQQQQQHSRHYQYHPPQQQGGLPRSSTSASAPELRRSYSRSVLDDMTCDVAGEFRNCRHCRTIFPFVQPPGADPAGREALRLSFCSGECHLSFVTLYHIQRQRRRSARRMR